MRKSVRARIGRAASGSLTDLRVVAALVDERKAVEAACLCARATKTELGALLDCAQAWSAGAPGICLAQLDEGLERAASAVERLEQSAGLEERWGAALDRPLPPPRHSQFTKAAAELSAAQCIRAAAGAARGFRGDLVRSLSRMDVASLPAAQRAAAEAGGRMKAAEKRFRRVQGEQRLLLAAKIRELIACPEVEVIRLELQR